MPDKPLNILFVDDSPEDVFLLVHYLQGAGIPLDSQRVDTAEDLVRILRAGPWDVVLSDYNLPGFSAKEAIALVREMDADLPILVVSGQVGEEYAVEVLKAGAQDFITKQNLSRLIPAIQREYADSQTKRTKKQLATELTETQERLQAIGHAAMDAILLMDPKGCISYWNPAAEKLFGYSAQEALGCNLHRLLAPPEIHKLFSGGFAQLIADGRGPVVGQLLEMEAIGKNGRIIPVELTVSSIHLSSGWHAVGIIRDITERKQQEKALRDSEAQYRLIVDTAAEGIFMTDDLYKIRFANRQFGELLGCEADTLLGRSLLDFMPVGDLEARWAQMLKGHQDCQMKKLDGSLLWAYVSVRPLLGADGQKEGILGMVADITEGKEAELARQAMEVQLRNAQKLEAIGQLAAGIAHEINTPTQYIGDNLVFLKETCTELMNALSVNLELVDRIRRHEGPITELETVQHNFEALDLDYLKEELPRAIQQSLEGVNRVSRIVGAMKDFSHPGSESKSRVDLNRAIENTLTISKNEWKYVAEAETELDPNLPLVLAHRGEMNQVILNLVVNAAHAIESALGGRQEDRKGRIALRTRTYDDWVEIRVEDTGTGIPEAIRHRIFDPFFTTKAVGRGTGQGLAIVHHVVVDMHGGNVALETEEGRGSTFILRLPIDGGEVP